MHIAISEQAARLNERPGTCSSTASPSADRDLVRVARPQRLRTTTAAAQLLRNPHRFTG
jgi:hypothetical protein